MRKIDSQKMNEFFKITISDVILVLFILVATAGTVISKNKDINVSASFISNASVFHEGEAIKHFKLDKDQEIVLFDGRMILEVEGGRLRVKKSDCPHQTCVHIGWIHYPGETIACIPYDTLVEIDRSDSMAVDAVIY